MKITLDVLWRGIRLMVANQRRIERKLDLVLSALQERGAALSPEHTFQAGEVMDCPVCGVAASYLTDQTGLLTRNCRCIQEIL